jgi:hypothetical protein
MEVSGQVHAPAALPQGKSPWYPLDRSLGGPQSRHGCDGEEKNSQSLQGLEPPIIQPVAQCYTTELPLNLFSAYWNEKMVMNCEVERSEEEIVVTHFQ